MQDPQLQSGGPWYAVLSDPEGFILDSPAEHLEDEGPEAVVSISIRRGSALPDVVEPGRRLPGSSSPDDVVFDVDWDLVDEDGETTAVEAKLAQARAMAAGLNRAEANPRDWNRGTELAATLHDLADRLAAFDGILPHNTNLMFSLTGSTQRLIQTAVDGVDALGRALLGEPGVTSRGTGGGLYEHQAQKKLGNLTVSIYTYVPPPAEEDPAALRARIAELEARLAEGGGSDA